MNMSTTELHSDAQSTKGKPTDCLEPLAAWEISLKTVTAVLRLCGVKMESEVKIPMTWFDVLVQLVETPGGRLRMRDLAELVILSPSGLTRLVDRIEKAGLVVREASREDRRETAVVLTEEGLALALRARETHHRHLQEYFSRHLNDDDMKALWAAFSKVRNGLTGNTSDLVPRQRDGLP
jgi:DNA-binding MarR family transcriptional regulator